MDDRDRMDRRPPWIPWAFTSLALVIVAIVAYSLGAQRETVDGAAEPVRRVWVGGFSGFWLIFLLFWVFGSCRRMWWWGAYPYRPWRYGPYYDHPYDRERDDWDEWHRRAHDRIDSSKGRTPTTSAGNDRAPIT